MDQILLDLIKVYKNCGIDNAYFLNLLCELVENSDDDDFRLECLEIMNEFNQNSEDIFLFIENLFISDMNPDIKFAALKIMINNYSKKKIIKPILHVLNKCSGNFHFNLMEILSKLNPFYCKKILIEKIKSQKSENNDLSWSFNENLKSLSLEMLKQIYYNMIFEKSLEDLYFHRNKIPFVVNF